MWSNCHCEKGVEVAGSAMMARPRRRASSEVVTRIDFLRASRPSMMRWFKSSVHLTFCGVGIRYR